MTATSLLFRAPAPVASPVTVRPVRREDASTLLRMARELDADAAAWTDLLEFHEALFDAPVRAWAWLACVGNDTVGHAVATVGFSLRARGYCLQLDTLRARNEWRIAAESVLFEEVRATARRLGCVQLQWHDTNGEAARRFGAPDARADGIRHVMSLA
ncbi:hypothetical protein [Lysobacter arvi]|uniref:N-acetyltransferase domain-containing protein n=1 Tax=Lysobacter arvi TaxID=3038776 RepID=A0ABU1CHN6_9GAMM|nr:hypothetical protein [Lysobacter arvi]MDR0184465.1 hypothetical protein [Lysobacter arvi]